MQAPQYATIVLYGEETDRKVGKFPLFSQIIQEVTSFAPFGKLPLKCRGEVWGRKEKKGQRLAPKGGAFSNDMLLRWRDVLAKEDFSGFAIRSFSGPAKTTDPTAFFDVTKCFTGDKPIRTDDYYEPGNCITVALQHRHLEDQWEQWEQLGASLATLIDCTNGFMEQSRPWGIPHGKGFTGELMQYRWREVSNHEYGDGEYGRMDRTVSKLRWRCFLRTAHFKSGIRAIKQHPLVERAQRLSDGLYLIAFKEDPENNPAHQRELSKLFHMTKPAQDD